MRGMRAPALDAEIERRLLINYRADPDVVTRLLPAPFRPDVVNGWAVVGICLIRLGAVRPHGWPRALGLRSENAAHRIAVEWDGEAGLERGVYIPRRDSSALTNVLVGGRLYPGAHQRADFDVHETATTFHVGFTARDGSAGVDVQATLADALDSRIFTDLAEASAFFRGGSAGLSPGHGGRSLEGLRLETDHWAVEPLTVTSSTSSFFADRHRFPLGSVELDCGLLMRHIPVTWSAIDAPDVVLSA
jgi:hypothetical protein